jgi:hypothetical protein
MTQSNAARDFTSARSHTRPASTVLPALPRTDKIVDFPVTEGASLRDVLKNNDKMTDHLLKNGPEVLKFLERISKSQQGKDLIQKAFMTPGFIPMIFAGRTSPHAVGRIWALIRSFDPKTQAEILTCDSDSQGIRNTQTLLQNPQSSAYMIKGPDGQKTYMTHTDVRHQIEAVMTSSICPANLKEKFLADPVVRIIYNYDGLKTYTRGHDPG